MKKILLLIIILILLLIPKVNASTTSASSYILMDGVTGRVLLSKDMNSKRLIASITKIMTSIIAIESGKVEAILALPNKLFSNVSISVQCWVLRKDKTNKDGDNE